MDPIAEKIKTGWKKKIILNIKLKVNLIKTKIKQTLITIAKKAVMGEKMPSYTSTIQI
jgi:hypothetical protein